MIRWLLAGLIIVFIGAAVLLVHVDAGCHNLGHMAGMPARLERGTCELLCGGEWLPVERIDVVLMPAGREMPGLRWAALGGW